MKKIKILIADDHPIFRSGVKDVLSKIADFEIVAEAENGMQAYQNIISLLPDVAVLDLEMPVLNGLDVCRKVLNEKHHTEFIVLTMHKEKQYFLDAMNSGVNGYLLKDNAIDELVVAVRKVALGEKIVSQQMQYLLKETLQFQHSNPDLEKVSTLLTPTEKVILKLISDGKTTAEIATMLFVSPNTIENHRANMTKKLKLEGKNSLLKFSLQLKRDL
jgi:two-component system, NarL family, response regulator DegU